MIQSDATGSGSLIHSTSGVNATVQQYLTDNTATYYYHTNSSPVSNALAAVYLLSGAGPYLYSYDPAGTTSKWINITNVNTPLSPGKGYLINYKTRTTPETVSLSGPLNTGNFDLSLSSAGDGNNLIGNPYPCAIDWDASSGWTFGSTDNYITIWNPADGSYGSYVRGVGTGTHGVTNIIPSGQGFFVHAPVNTTLSMTNAVKVHDNSLIKSAKLSQNYFKLRVTNDTNSFNDEIVVYYHWEATRDFDSGLEAKKVFSIMKESSQMYTQSEEGTNLAINALPEGYSDSIVLYFKCGIQADYTIRMVENNGVGVVNITDLLNGNSENLLTNEYKFSASPNDTVIRFVINSQMGGNTKINPVPASKTEEVAITPTLDGLHLRNLTDQPLQGALTITSLLGRTIYQEDLTLITDETRFGFKSGIYIVSFRMNNEVEVKKIFIQ
ncbi:MAG: T9SS type A sorting domain-containing protein [Bacteroidales bacterium]